MNKGKRNAVKVISVILSAVMLMSAVPMQAFAEEKTATESIQQSELVSEGIPEEEPLETESAVILAEDTEKREENVKHFRMSDGTMQAAQYAEPVHFLKDGVWTDYDNTLTEVDADAEENEGRTLLKNKDLTNQTADYSVRLSKKTNGKKFVRIEKDGYKLSWYYVGANKSTAKVAKQSADDGDPTTLEKLSSTVLYKDVFKSTDLEYIIGSTGLKENLILDSKKAPKEFTAEYRANGLTPVQVDDKAIELHAEDGTVIYTVTAPFMTDADGAYSDGVTLTLESVKNNTFSVKITLDGAWLDAKDRAYPVTVDPALKTEQSVSNAQTAFVSAKYPNKCYLAAGSDDMGSLYVGNIDVFGRTETYIKFTKLPDIGIGSKVVDARLLLGLRKCEVGLQVNVKRLVNDWDEKTVTWNNGPYGEGIISDYLNFTPQTDVTHHQEAEITDMVRGWYSGDYPNYGLSLTTDKTAAAKAWFFSIHYTTYYQNRPLMVISYRNMSGYEDYWSYTNVSAGRGGVASVNNFTGNLVFSQAITQGDGGDLMPVNISLIYNANQEKRYSNELKPYAGHSLVGCRMQTNYHIYIRYDSKLVGEGYKYYLNDADGTKHWLKTETVDNKTVYKDEDGLGLTLTEIPKNSVSTAADAVFEMVSKDETKMYFDTWGNLIQIKSPTGVTNNLAYTDGGGNRRLDTITDGAGRVYTFLYTKPNDPEMVTGIKDPAGRITTIAYTGAYTVDYIQFADQKKVVFSHNTDWLITEIKGIDGTRTKISYDSSDQKRVSQINWGTSDTNLLEKYSFAYKQNSTKVTDIQNRSYTYQFNDWGQTTGVVSDTDGSAQFFKLHEGNSTDSHANKLIQESRVLQTVTNYAVNPGFTRAYSDGYANYIENTENQSISIDTGKKNLTNNALKIYKAASNTGRVNAVQYVNGLAAGTYTFSSHITTDGATLTGGAWLLAEVWNGTNWVSSNWGESTSKTDGWERKSVTFTVSAGQQVRLILGFGAGGSGTVWYDDLQLEKGEGASTFNLVENSGFTNGMSTWLSEGGEAGTRTWAGLAGFDYCGKLPGTVEGRYKSLLQSIPVSGKKGNVFSFGMWAYAASAPLNSLKDDDAYKPHFEIVLHYYGADGRWKGYIHLDCNPDLKNEWQFVTKEAIIPEDYGKIAISLLYDHNVNNAYVTGAFCYKEQYGQTYDYDKNGNVVSTVDLAKTNSTFAYYGNQMAKMLNPSGSKYIYAYNSKKQLTYALSSDGQQYGFTYDDKGNATKAEITAKKPATEIESGKSYYLINAFSGHALNGGAGNSGEWVTTCNYADGNAKQQWKVRLVDGTTDVYTIQADAYTDKNLYLDVKGGTNTDNIVMELFPYNGGNAQKFKLVKKQEGTFSIFTACSNYTKLLDGQKLTGNEISEYQSTRQSVVANAEQPPEGMRWYFYPVENSSDKTIATETTYTDSKNFVKSTKDQRGNETTYAYNEQKGTLTSTTDALGRTTSYTYDPNNNSLLSVSSGGMTNSYAYENDRLKTITVNGGLRYAFEYDAFGRTTSTKVGNGTNFKTLSSLEYNNKGLLGKQTYGNGDYIDFTYDNLDRITEKKYNGDANNRAVYRYGNDGSLAQTIDFSTGTRTKFTYDLADRLVSQKEYTGTGNNGGALISSTDFTYADKTNYLTGVKHFSPLGTQNIGYTYGDINLGQMPDQIYKVSWNGEEKLNYVYDPLGRLTSKTILVGGGVSDAPHTLDTQYTYFDVGTDKTTTLLKSLQTPAGTYNYTYDAVGNITSVQSVDDRYHYSFDYTSSFAYDDLNQLVRENNPQLGKTYTYSYVNGNITERKEYAYTTGELGEVLDTKTWSYNDHSWSDLLTDYNGISISYDLSGNPTAIGNQTLTWNGRQLQSIIDGDNAYNYAYNTDGQRVSKTVNGVTTEYFYNGEILAGQKTGNETLVFMYDNNGDIFGFIYDGHDFYYVKNAQNDVVGLVSDGNIVAYYFYDAWGNAQIVNDAGYTIYDMGHPAYVNPIRYRSYYYDHETNFYYLNSRYYSPDICRFLNADDSDIIDGGNDHALENNLFAYCLNNPVIFKDEDGEWVHLAVGAAIGAITSVVGAAIEGKRDWRYFALAAATGAASGFLAASGVGMIGQIVGGAAIGAAGNLIGQKAIEKSKKIDAKSLLVDTVIGGVSGALGGKGASKGNSKSAMKLGKQFTKNVKNSIKYNKKSIGNSYRYYIKNMHTVGGARIYKNLFVGSSRSGGWTVATSLWKRWR